MDPSQQHLGTSGCLAAFRSVRTAKNCFMLLIALVILLQLAGFALVNWVGVLDELHIAQAQEPEPTAQPATVQAQTLADPGDSTIWQEILNWSLPAAKFVAFVSALLIVLTLMFAVKLAVADRLDGVAGLMSAFFWSLILLAAVTPWQQVLGGPFASGATYNLGELTAAVAKIKPGWGAQNVQLLDQVIYYARFVAFPVATLLVWLVVMLKFAKGYKDSVRPPVGTIQTQAPAQPGL